MKLFESIMKKFDNDSLGLLGAVLGEHEVKVRDGVEAAVPEILCAIGSQVKSDEGRDMLWRELRDTDENVASSFPSQLHYQNSLGLVENGKQQLAELYPHVNQIEEEKVTRIEKKSQGFKVTTNKNEYSAKVVVVTVGYTNLMTIKGLEKYTEPHPRAVKEKDRIWLKNEDHLIEENLYVAGTLAGWRSQFAIASGSGAHVATDILTLWNDGKHTKIHDKV